MKEDEKVKQELRRFGFSLPFISPSDSRGFRK
jgi:hypothetical protein